MSKTLAIALVLQLSLFTGINRSFGDDGFQNLFNGKDLDGWRGSTGFWSVEDGAIVGETTADKPTSGNTFLVWQGGEVADFEFVGKVRFKGNNSGVQYRSKLIDEQKFVLSGYQMDLHPSQDFFGMLYGEKYEQRGKIATRGQRTEIDAEKKVTVIGKVGDETKFIDWEWNTIRILAVGNRLVHQVNGITTIDVTDRHPSAASKGVLGLQLHAGKPMRVEFKEIQLQRLNAEQGRSVLAALDGTSAENLPETKQGNRLSPSKEELHSAVIKALPDFRVETIYEVPLETQGSWVALAIDPKGRLFASDQGTEGLYRITVTDPKSPKVEKLPVELSSAQGLVWKGDALYASITASGIHRVTDTNGDDLPDHAELLTELNGRGEHGNHALFDTRDSQEIFAVAGNHTPLPATQMSSRTRVQSYAEDLLLPRQWDARGHAAGILAPGGWFTRFDPMKKSHELFCIGFRNQYDAAMNAQGDIFTYDADMEWDLGLPWYRPTRICHVVSGGDFGWRSGSGKWPEYYEDSLPALVNIGPGSPTGVVSGQGTRFPKRYQDAMYALDWTYGRILAIHMKPDGASYKAESELFVSGIPLPVTDAVVGMDGALYFTTGGRGANSSLKRVVYTGSESTANTSTTTAALPREAVLRRELEVYHGVVDAKALEAAWPHLSSDDRFLRHAARVAIESQPVSGWAQRVATEPNSQARIAATVALARRGQPEHQAALLTGLAKLDFQALPLSQQLGLLRALSLTLERLGKPSNAARDLWVTNLESVLPNRDTSVKLEAMKLLVYLDAPSAVAKGMQMIADRSSPKAPSWEGVEEMNARYGSALKRLQSNPTPAVEISYAFALRTAKKGWTLELRRKYFEFLNEAGKAGGGASYPGYLENTRDEALATCTDEERVTLADLTGRSFNPVPDFPITPPVGPGKEWTLDEALSATPSKKAGGADFERGRNLFHAVQCGACHRFQGLGGGVGPDLTSVPNKFDMRYLIEAMINPSKDISDQYQSSNVLMEDGRTLSGLVIEQDAKTLLVYPSDPKAKRIVVSRDEVEKLTPSKVSQMPVGLLNSLNRDEIRDLTAYIMSGGNPKHKSFEKQGKK